MFTPITTCAQVPDVGRGFESPVLDLKEYPEAYKPFFNGQRKWNDFELAKDVTACANSLGGTVLGAENCAAASALSALPA